jgi:hypothetical protein
MELHECVWWPQRWKTTNGVDVPAQQVSQDGIFETCELSGHDLIFEIVCNGKAVIGSVTHSLNSPNLGNVRDFRLQYSGDSMATIENLDVQPDQFNTKPWQRPPRSSSP